MDLNVVTVLPTAFHSALIDCSELHFSGETLYGRGMNLKSVICPSGHEPGQRLELAVVLDRH